MCRPGLWAVLVVLALGATSPALSLDAEEFAERLALAKQLNTTAPWRESQAILDELRPHLELADADQYAEFVYLEARNLTLAGKLDEALERLEAALERDMSPVNRNRMLRLAANVAVLARRFEETFAFLRQALALLEREQLASDDGVYSLASYVYTQVGELERGLQYGELATRVARAAGDNRRQCSAEVRLAYVHKVAGDLDAGAPLYRQGIQHCLAADEELIAGVAEVGLADLLRMRGDHAEAAALFEQGVERLERTDYQSGLAEARLYWARLEYDRQNDERVVELLNAGLPQYAEDDNAEYLAEAHEMLASLARRSGDLERALSHYDQYMAAREQFLEEKRARRLAYLEVEFDLRHTVQQLALAREQARVSELELQSRRQQARLALVGSGLGAVVLVMLVLLLIQAKRDRRRYQSLSRRDGLTGVNNHTHFFALATKALENPSDSNQPFTLILGDIDHFKQVNDTHGHGAGDEVLRRVGARLRECFGDGCIVGRIGGEEFGVALPGKGVKESEAMLDEFRDRLGDFRVGDAEIYATMSFGIAPRCSPTENLTQLYDRADAALYRAKHEGRNRVIHA
ncbi:MAG: diguanylate cyclase [Xanthomonadales bacterium]|nr:diguanylate cyclase [Xanthomonadales bacterium]